jgi:predicted PurR-regulated permease PerM
MTAERSAERRDSAVPQIPGMTLRLALAGILLVLVWVLGHALLILFCGVLIGVFLEALSAPATRLGIPRIVGLLAVLIVLSAIAVLFFYFFGASVASQLQSLTSSLDDSASTMRARLEGWGLTDVLQASDKQLADVLPSIRSVLGRTAAAAWGAFGIFGNTLVAVMIGIFIAAEPGAYRRSLLAIVPHNKRAGTGRILDEMGATLRWWLLARFVNMTLIFLLTWAGLALIGVPQALVLSLLAGLLAFIPTLGPIIAAIPIILSALSVGVTAALWAIAVCVVVQSLESYVLTPVVQKRAIELYPAFILGLQFIMATIFGVLGLAVATPLGAMALVIWREAGASNFNAKAIR